MPEMPADEPGHTWWRDGVLYQIYPRSYMDTNGDGVGDLRGITERLDHLAWLGVAGIWLDPVMPSPNDDWGYDVADYVNIDAALGTLADADELIAEATKRGIRVVMDLVPNHTSDRHAWFQDAKSSRTAEHRDWYVWADPKPDGSPPNNWNMAFDPRVPAWTFDEHTGQYYLNQFLPSQPDLNWWNPEVRDTFDDILRFWFDRGVAGFRIDVAHSIVKDARAARQPARDEGRSLVGAAPRATHDVQCVPPRGARRAAALAQARRQLRPAPCAHRRDIRARTRSLRFVLRPRRRAQPGVQLHADPRAVPRAGDAKGYRDGGAAAPHDRLAGVDGWQPRQSPFPHALGRERPGARAGGDGDAHGAPRHTVPLLRGRDRHGRHRRPARARPRPGRQAPRPAHGSGPGTHADALDRGRRCRLQRAGRRAVAAVRRLPGEQRRDAAQRSRLDADADA